MSISVHYGDCIEVMREFPDATFDSVVTDPPYGIGFMGLDWDKAASAPGFQEWTEEWARECLRVLKPGGHLVSFGGARTWHRVASGIEDAGFELRDNLAWLFMSGFPHSMDVSKAVDKALGGVRGKKKVPVAATAYHSGAGNRRPWMEAAARDGYRMVDDDTPVTPQAQQWRGWGTTLKPAFEPIVLARKPLDGTVANTVLTYGTGALNIDACRMPPRGEDDKPRHPHGVHVTPTVSAMMAGEHAKTDGFYPVWQQCPKAGSGERPKHEGLSHPAVKPLGLMRWLVRLTTQPGGVVLDPFAGSGATLEAAELEGMSAVGIELERGYAPLIGQRIARN